MADVRRSEAANALYFLHTSPIMKATKPGAAYVAPPMLSLDQRPIPLYPGRPTNGLGNGYHYGSNNGYHYANGNGNGSSSAFGSMNNGHHAAEQDVVFGDERSNSGHDAAGLLCSLMSSAASYGRPRSGSKSKRKSPLEAKGRGGKKMAGNRSRAGSMMSIATDVTDDVDMGRGYDSDGIIGLERTANKNGKIGAYSPEARRRLIERFMKKRQNRRWKKRIKYDVRKNFADSRLRVKGRFVRKEDEMLLKDMLSMI